MIELPQTTLWVAAVFFHRFYMRLSMDAEKSGIHHYVSDSALEATAGSNQGLGWHRLHSGLAFFSCTAVELTDTAFGTEHRSDCPLPSEQD